MTEVYLRTDSNEVSHLLMGVNGDLEIKSLDINNGKTVQEDKGLDFNPMSVISFEEFGYEKKELIEKLLNEKLKFAVLDEDGLTYYPKK